MRRSILGAISLMLLAFSLCFGLPQQQQSVADAARKAKEQKKTPPKPAKVYTNDNLASVSGVVNVVGSVPPPAGEGEAAGAKPEAAEAKPGATEDQAAKDKDKDKEKDKNGEAAWRKRFAEARGRLRGAEKELDIMQRELNLQQQQYYSDPNKALRQQNSRSDINNLTKAIEDKKQEVAKLKQALSDLEDELRRAGGDPAWARE